MSKFFDDTMQGLLEAAAMENDKVHCHLCGKEIVFDGVEPLPVLFSCGDDVIHYCSKHAEMGQEIFNRFYAEKSGYMDNYCDEVKLLNKIEKQFTSNVGDWYIQFPNLHNNGAELMNVPILKDGKPIGFVSNVDDNYVTGRIWSRYIPIVEELAADDNHTMSFELVC